MHDGWVLVLGSSYGAKSGPLEPERSFVARFQEDDVVVGVVDVPPEGDAILVGAPAEIVHHFTGLSRVEGLARDQEGRVLCVSDEDDVIRTRFFTSDPAAV